METRLYREAMGWGMSSPAPWPCAVAPQLALTRQSVCNGKGDFTRRVSYSSTNPLLLLLRYFINFPFKYNVFFPKEFTLD